VVRIFILMSLAWLSVTSLASADSLVDRTGVGAQFGIQKLVGGNHDYSNVDQNFGVWLRRGFSPRWSIEAGLNYGYNRPGALKDEDAGFDFGSVHAFYTTMTTGYVGARYHLAPEKRFGPYLGGQLGVMGWRVRDANGQGNMGLFPEGPAVSGFDSNGDPAQLEGTNLTAGLILGAEYFLNERFSLDVGARYSLILGNDKDNIGSSALWGPDHADVNDGRWDMFVGGTWYFGGSSDRDGDGIENDADACPDAPEDFDGFQDQDGCPEDDNDGDGVLDVDDLCPEDAEDLDGYRDDDGCPDPDNDNDGVVDAYDYCPDDPEDVDGWQDDDGCPDPDNDGDGVLDGADNCPRTPAGAAVDAHGCPTASAMGSATVLTGVSFAVNSADLANGSFAALAKVVTALLAYPEVTYEIQGHTDNTGSLAYNLDISSRRAQTVKNYLIGHGVAAEQLTSVGYGPDVPIASNTTTEGRAANRRVEMVRTN